MRRILVTGSRNWTDYNTIADALDNAFDKLDPAVLVHGDCPSGADKIAQDYALSYNKRWKKYPAEWAKYGKLAGPLRNELMVDKGAAVCLVFIMPCSKVGCTMKHIPHASHGATHCARYAKSKSVPLVVYYGPGFPEGFSLIDLLEQEVSRYGIKR